MPSLSAKDRVSLCQFTFADGRRCRTSRTGKNPHFCFDHAQKEARANAAESLGKDLAYFFSGDYLSACDLSTALGRLIPAVILGDVKPRTARTVAYLAQTLLQTIHLAEHEYTNTFGSDGWRKSIRLSVNDNYNHRFPNTQRSGGLQAGPVQQPQPTPIPLPNPPHPASVAHPGIHPDPAGRGEVSPAQPPTQDQQPTEPPAKCDSHAAAQAFRTKESPSSNSSLATHHSPLPSAPSPLPTARSTTSPTQSSAGVRHCSQQQSEPQSPVASPSATRQEPRPTAGPQTGPSGLPVLAPLPPRNPAAPAGSRSS